MRVRADFLWPLGAYRSDGERSSFRLTPLHVRHTRPDGPGPDWDAVTLLLLWTGRDPEAGGYASLFPLGGTLKDRIGKDRIDYVLFPLWSRTVVGETRSHNVLWPFFNRTTGAVRGSKAWPLYGRYRKSREDGTPVSDRRFFLWPFVTFHRDGLDRQTPSRLLFLFPFYGSFEGRVRSDRAWLFPFFRHRVQRGSQPREDWKMPFPFVHIGWGEGYRRRDFWPFAGRLTVGDLRRTYAIWPLIRHETRSSSEGRDAMTFVLPFYIASKAWDAQGEPARSRRLVWPLYGRSAGPGGARSRAVLPLLWFADETPPGRLFGPILRLYGASTSGDGTRRVTALFGIFTTVRSPGEGLQWRLLGGLLGREEAGGRRRTRFLFVRWGRG
ncbi:MAG: hypothetical protein HY608_05500, partial [Planctomycetes bacterium]|nr:hypothetical protein [Planctomycetota bacterium]